eukprot:3170529-Pleurochrysis_carterae.AAC.1
MHFVGAQAPTAWIRACALALSCCLSPLPHSPPPSLSLPSPLARARTHLEVVEVVPLQDEVAAARRLGVAKVAVLALLEEVALVVQAGCLARVVH